MLKEEWITTQIVEARKSHLNVTEAVAIRIKELLSGPFVEQQLTSAELKDISMRLIDEMVPNAPETDGKQ
jgi:hypothetical protein